MNDSTGVYQHFTATCIAENKIADKKKRKANREAMRRIKRLAELKAKQGDASALQRYEWLKNG